MKFNTNSHRIHLGTERDDLWDHCLITDELMTMRYECRAHKSDCQGRFDYFCEAFPVADALKALRELPDAFGIDTAVWEILFRLPSRLPYESSEPVVIALADAEGNAFSVVLSPQSQTPDAVEARQPA
jgi:hypothetical protein